MRPAAARTWRVADHGAATDRAFTCATTEAVLPALACGATWEEPALFACEHRVHDHTLPNTPIGDARTDLADHTNVLVAERERVRAKRLEREGIVCRDRRKITAADPTQDGIHAHPVVGGQPRWIDVVERYAAGGSERELGRFAGGCTREQIPQWTIVEADSLHDWQSKLAEGEGETGLLQASPSGFRFDVIIGSMIAPADDILEKLLQECAPFEPVPLCPEISAFQGRSLVEVWEAAEKIAGANLPAPFWAYPWAAGCGLARVLLDQPELVRDKRVLDLGAGGGVTSIAAAFVAAREVVANDVDPWALAVARLAASRQQLSLQFLLKDLTEDISSVDNFEVVLCSDMAYERRMTPRYQTLLMRARNRGATVIVADAGRTYFSAEGLELIAEFTMEVPRDLEGVSTRVARVYYMR